MSHAPLWFLDVCRPVVWLYARALFRIRFEGVAHVPMSGPVLITPNHVSYMDPVLITLPIHRPLNYLALEPFFRVPVLGALIRWGRALPIREDEVNEHAVRAAVRLLRGGEPLVVFPEGGRSPDGRLQPFRLGAFRLALAADAPVVPVAIAGGFEAWPVGRRLPRPGHITITYHAPVTRKDLPPETPRKAQPALMADLVRQRISAVLVRSA
ncbi:MAG: lysophospholipid acyltransferase family protein [Candidatus Rokuibacteriota bacterium]